MKPWKKDSVKTDLPNFVPVMFHWKMLNDLLVQLKLMRPYIKVIIDSDRHSTTREIAVKVNV